MDLADLNNRFSFHSADTEVKRQAHEAVRTRCLQLAMWLNELVPEGRQKALAITSLEDVMHWANGALACAGGPLVPADSIDRYGTPNSDGA